LVVRQELHRQVFLFFICHGQLRWVAPVQDRSISDYGRA
jgi:hypothetical protein